MTQASAQTPPGRAQGERPAQAPGGAAPAPGGAAAAPAPGGAAPAPGGAAAAPATTPGAAVAGPDVPGAAPGVPSPVTSPAGDATAEAFVEPDPNVATQDDLQGLRSDLENFKFQWQRERDLHTALSTRSLLIGGVVQARIGWSEQPVNTATSNDRKVTFDTGAAILSFNGILYKDYEEGRNLIYSVRFGASPQQASNNSFLNLLDAQLSYSILPTLGPEDWVLQVTLGQQLLPFGLEVPASEELKPVITNAQFTTKLGLNRRDLGLIVRGDILPQVDYGYNYRAALLAYAVGITNGSGPNTPDDNSEKDLLGRLAFTVPSDYNSLLRQITLGGSVYFGWQNTFLKDEKKTLSGKGVKRRYGADIYYNHYPIGVTYEFIYGQDDATLGTTPDDPRKTRLTSLSHVATFFYNWGEQFLRGYRNQGRYDDWWPKTYQPFLRIDLFDPSTEVLENRVDVYTLGFNLFFAETTKFQLNFNRRDDRTNTEGAQHELLAQLQGGF
ncbi:porin [Sorangium cellulosum]|uniref:porin n=1 Tax=Sorangium cellulosum TaxID=56 RepID=UPI001F3C37A5|nr:porin [Sorangium cellulosum]